MVPKPGCPVPSHNPDNLTPSQYGQSEGWRLLDEDELHQFGPESYGVPDGLIEGILPDGSWYPMVSSGPLYTYRTRLTRAELRKARGLETKP